MRKKDLLDRIQKGDGDLYPQFLLPPRAGPRDHSGAIQTPERGHSLLLAAVQKMRTEIHAAPREEILRGRRYDGARAVRATAP